jgi:exosome complex component RRP46
LLTHNPRTLIQLVVQSLTPVGKFQGPLIAAMINASTLALMKAGSIPMRGVVCAVSVGRLRSNSESSPILVLDPSDDEVPSLAGGGCFAFLFNASQKGGSEVVWSNWQSTAPVSEDTLISARVLARGGAEKVWKAMKESIGWMGNREPLTMQSQSSKSVVVAEESGSDEESDDDEMDI